MWFELKTFIDRTGRKVSKAKAKRKVGTSGQVYFLYIAGLDAGILFEEVAKERMEALRDSGKVKESEDQSELDSRFEELINNNKR